MWIHSEQTRAICYSHLLDGIIKKAASAPIINQLIDVCKYIIIIIIIITNVCIIDSAHLSSQRLVFLAAERRMTDCGG